MKSEKPLAEQEGSKPAAFPNPLDGGRSRFAVSGAARIPLWKTAPVANAGLGNPYETAHLHPRAHVHARNRIVNSVYFFSPARDFSLLAKMTVRDR